MFRILKRAWRRIFPKPEPVIDHTAYPTEDPNVFIYRGSRVRTVTREAALRMTASRW